MTVNSGQDGPLGPTVTVRFTHAILQTAERLGVTLPADLVAEVHADERVPLAVQDRLWDAFCSASDDPLIGLELGRAVQVGHLDAAGMVLMTCETLGEALDSLLEYHPIVGEGGDFELQATDAGRALVYRPHYDVRRAQRVEAVLACLLNLTRWSTGGTFAADAVSFIHEPLAPRERYAERLEAKPVFGAAENALRFPAAAMDLPLIQANPALCRRLHELADAQLAELGSRSVSGQVQQLLREHPHWGKERVAERLGMSGRHLVRKLGEEGARLQAAAYAAAARAGRGGSARQPAHRRACRGAGILRRERFREGVQALDREYAGPVPGEAFSRRGIPVGSSPREKVHCVLSRPRG